MLVSLVVAAAENDVIGNAGKLPWSLPDDLKYFRQVTEGKPVIMGRKTFESIGRALPGRLNIIITRNPDWKTDTDVRVVQSLEAALEQGWQSGAEEACVIGGREIYALALPIANRIHLTRVHAEIGGDTTLPAIDWNKWKETSATRHDADEKHAYPFTFFVYERR